MKIIVISELGVNHNGDMDKLEKMIIASKNAGVDGVKLQYYNVDDLGVSDELYEKLKKAQLSLEQIKEAKNIAERNGLIFLCTPMVKFELAKQLSGIGLKWCKIREKDSYNYDFIRDCLPLFERIYVSTTRKPVGDIHIYYHPRIFWVYTVPKYPAEMKDIDFEYLQAFQGYSNHVPSIIAPVASCSVARIRERKEWYLEVHFTLDHNLKDIDDSVSFDVDELTKIVGMVRELEW